MEIIQQPEKRQGGIKFVIHENGAEVGRVFLYLLYNDLHAEPFGLVEDVFVEEAWRGRGLGAELVKAVIEEAKKQSCYKLICTSRTGRDKLHEWYRSLGFKEHGKEFRMDF
jgi:GNAT superfamily N-acetyltransferase